MTVTRMEWYGHATRGKEKQILKELDHYQDERQVDQTHYGMLHAEETLCEKCGSADMEKENNSHTDDRSQRKEDLAEI